MAKIILTNLDSDVSGYKLALVDTRNPSSTALVTSVTAAVATSGAKKIQLTATSGGTALKWITKPLTSAVTLSAVPAFANTWAKESATTTNAKLQWNIRLYHGAESSTIYGTVTDAAELSATVASYRIASANLSAQAFAVGDRMVITGYVVNVGLMAAGTITLDYDGPTAGSDGDTFFHIAEAFPVKRQLGDGTPAKGFSRTYYQSLIDQLNQLLSGKMISGEEPIQSMIDRFTVERDDI